MKEEEFSSRTRANMEVALDRVCSRHPDGESHELRKRVAEHIGRCAKKGETTLTALVAAGEAALPKKRETKKRSA
jgi:hypothetical protein